MNYEEAYPKDWLNDPAQGFTGVVAGNYWSSTTFAPNTSLAWYVDVNVGNVGNNGTDDANYYVLAVRSGQ